MMRLKCLSTTTPGVLNLIINGIPSILKQDCYIKEQGDRGFKPYYKWNTFNTIRVLFPTLISSGVLNLIINGIPSIPL